MQKDAARKEKPPPELVLKRNDPFSKEIKEIAKQINISAVEAEKLK